MLSLGGCLVEEEVLNFLNNFMMFTNRFMLVSLQLFVLLLIEQQTVRCNQLAFAGDAGEALAVPADQNSDPLRLNLEENNPFKGIESAWKSFTQNLKNAIRDNIAPKVAYFLLMNRYHQWFKKYKALEKLALEKGSAIKKGEDVILEEYSRVDQVLAEEYKCRPADDPSRVEKIDFIYVALQRAIDRLEPMIDELSKDIKERISQPIDLNQLVIDQEQAKFEDQERVDRAMERVRKIALIEARDFVLGELNILARIESFNALARVATATTPVWLPIELLKPVIVLLGQAHVPLLVCYLQSIEFRTALLIINEIDPVQKVICEIHKHDLKKTQQ